jgi:cation diffusion facilitator CzcD-associated flavoprotein CzcO
MIEPAESASYELCIVGAGIAGLNAAFVATRYLSRDSRVLLLDRHERPGGMWNDAYSYVRLHQPYSFFTAGNIPWSLTEKRGHLASGEEVRTHLRHCLQVISQGLDIDVRWGWEYLSRTEEPERVTIFARDPGGCKHTFTARRLINAAGFNISVNPPLALSSKQVRSTTPHLLARDGLFTPGDDAPVWVIGSGKTAMDTVQALTEVRPQGTISLIAGSGTYFFDRDTLYPTGFRRWWGGTPVSTMSAQAARRFNGTNVEEVSRWAQSHYTTSPIPSPIHNVGALLTRAEANVVRTGARQILKDHLIDVEDSDGGPTMVLRSGSRISIPEGSWVVNCTGFLGPREEAHDPYVSPGGRVLSINMTSTTTGVSGGAGYFLTHLLFLGNLSIVPLYALDWHETRRRAPQALPWVRCSLLAHNLSMIVENTPRSVLLEYGLNTDTWFPLPRRLIRQISHRVTQQPDRVHYRRALDNFGRATGVRCAPVTGTLQAAPNPRLPGGG